MSERVLILLRHAKSDWPAGVTDSERPLAGRGRRDAPVAGVLLEHLTRTIDLVLVSPAVRTRQTWALVSDHVTASQVRTEPAIYEATAGDLLDVLRRVPDSAETALLVGHNPGLADLAIALAGSGDLAARDRIAHKLPTCSVVLLRFGGSWSNLSNGDAELISHHVPRADSV